MGTSRHEPTPADCIGRLPEPALDAVGDLPTDELRNIELRHSILTIAELNHVNETALVRAVVTNLHEKVPTIEE
jgi:hypothetical protein